MVPELVGEVPTEESSHLFGPRFPAVEEATGGEVVSLLVYRELLVRAEGLVRVVRKIAEAIEDVLSRGVLWRQQTASFFLPDL